MLNAAIHPQDQMFTGDLDRYLRVGADALSKVNSVLSISGVTPSRILDYACGCGRVLRHFRNAFPDADIVGSDLMKHGVQFCSEQFASIPHTPSPRFDEVEFDRPFDLIWSGSLMTHVSEPAAKSMIAMFIRSLAPDGIAVWSTHGRYSAAMEQSGRWPYNLSAERMKMVANAFNAGDYGYADYDHMKGYGISMTPLPWLYETLAATDVRLVALIERGWDNHQDIVALQKRSVF